MAPTTKKLYRGWQSSAWSFLQDQWRLQKLTAIVFNWDHQAIIDQRPSQTPECTLIPGHSLHKQKQKLLGGKLGIPSPQDWDPLTLLKKSHRYHVWFILWYMLFCVCETSKLTLIYGLLWVKNLHFWLLDLSVKTLYWPGLHKLWYPVVRDMSTWSKFGAHGERGDVFLFSNLGALWFSENLIRYSLHICLREVKNNLFSFKNSYLRHFSWRF